MQSAIAAFAFLLALFGNSALAADYCDPSLCPTGKHIACNNDGLFASICVGAEDIDFTQEQKYLITQAHNEKRNIVAGGKSSLQPACRMGTMQWDNELAFMAALNVKKCVVKHDQCRNTETFRYSGQNVIGMIYYDNLNVTAMAQRSIDMWYNETMNTKQEYIDKYPRNYRGPPIGHFTVMMVDKNIRVGCAAATYYECGEDYNNFLFACNYATTNDVDHPIYKSCTQGGPDCTSGKNPDFPNLCSTSEVYDVNKW